MPDTARDWIMNCIAEPRVDAVPSEDGGAWPMGGVDAFLANGRHGPRVVCGWFSQVQNGDWFFKGVVRVSVKEQLWSFDGEE